MKQLTKFAGKLVLATSALGLATAFAAPPAATVFQRTSNTGAVELSNIDDADTSQAPLAVNPAQPSGAGATTAEPRVEVASGRGTATPAKVVKKIKKKIRRADGTEEEVLVDADEDSSDQANMTGSDTEGSFASGTRSSTEGAGNIGLGFGSASSAGYSGGYSGGTAGSTDAGGATAGTSTGSTGGSTGGNTGGSSTGGTSVAGGTTGATDSGLPTLPVPTSALQSKLETYRNQMLNEVTNAQASNPNPALTRRYQMMNRSTYQNLKGL